MNIWDVYNFVNRREWLRLLFFLLLLLISILLHLLLEIFIELSQTLFFELLSLQKHALAFGVEVFIALLVVVVNVWYI